MERQRQELGLGDTNGRLALYLIKMNSNNKGQSQIHKTENLLNIFYDNVDFPLFVARGFREFQKRKPTFT